MSVSPLEATVVCVLGMSRSGTSVAARLLNLAGVYLGPERELLQAELLQRVGEGESAVARAEEANREGFWEHYRLMRLNERILRAFGGNWRSPPDLPSGWEASERLAAEREEARALLHESFDGHRLWGWKDPRNSLTLPFWQELLPEMRYVVCLRNPVDVANSLHRRDGMPIEQGIDLWLAYVAAALVNTAGRLRLLVSHETNFADPQGAAARLAAFIGREKALADTELRERVAEAVDDDLWRHRTPAPDVVRSSRVPADVTTLYLVTELLATAPTAGLGGEERDADALDEAVNLYAAELLQRRSA